MDKYSILVGSHPFRGKTFKLSSEVRYSLLTYKIYDMSAINIENFVDAISFTDEVRIRSLRGGTSWETYVIKNGEEIWPYSIFNSNAESVGEHMFQLGFPLISEIGTRPEKSACPYR